MKIIARRSNLLGKITILVMVFLFINTAIALDGSGTEQDPWRIKSLEDFNDFAADANYWDDYTRLETDVNLAGRVYERAVIAWDVNDTQGGFQGAPFIGVFDGNDYTISNLTCDSNERGYIGLFGYVNDPNAEIKNLGLIDPNLIAGTGYYVGSLVGYLSDGTITGCYTVDGTISGRNYVGGLVGDNSEGTITNCYATGSVNGSGNVAGGLVSRNYGVITDCHATVSVTGNDSLGGLCGRSYRGTINNCYATGSVSGDDTVGGLCGWNDENPISNCYATGPVIGGGNRLGGLCGGNEQAQISNCYATGSVTGPSRSLSLGGLCGFSDSGYIRNCYATGSVTSGNWSRAIGGLCGSNSYGTVSNCYATGSVDGGIDSSKVGGLCGNAFGGTVTDSYFLDTAGPDNGLGIPLTDTQIKQQTSFVAWDFIDVWNIGENQTYPYLRVFLAGDINKDGIVNFLDVAITANQWMEEQF